MQSVTARKECGAPFLRILDFRFLIFDEFLSIEDIQELMNLGIEEALKLTPVEAKGKITTTWGCIRSFSSQ